MHRRTSIKKIAQATILLPWAPSLDLSATAKGFFSIEKRDDRWWLIDPQGQRFFSRGLNHVDPATLRYAENIHIWRDRYNNSMQQWLQQSVAPNLKAWGFNTLGWNQEVVTRQETNHRHSRRFTYDEYQWLDMPYCHQLPFGEFHQWEAETRHPDFFSEGFINWADHVAREHCATFANDPKLIGYFYIDCPTWLHTRSENHWKGPLFQPNLLSTVEGQEAFIKMARQYYRVTHDAIRRYDPNHLILGDRYEANEPLHPLLFEAAQPYVDVFSFQDFRKPAANLQHWYEVTGHPVLWADGSKKLKVKGQATAWNDASWYSHILGKLQENPGCVGVHLCGAYLQNKVRKKGLLDREEQANSEQIQLFVQAHQANERWMRAYDRE
ncbi:MAG: agarase [Bacteroidota bacterium]